MPSPEELVPIPQGDMQHDQRLGQDRGNGLPVGFGWRVGVGVDQIIPLGFVEKGEGMWRVQWLKKPSGCLLVQQRMPCISVKSYPKNLEKMVSESQTPRDHGVITYPRSRDSLLHYHIYNAEVTSGQFFCSPTRSHILLHSHMICAVAVS